MNKTQIEIELLTEIKKNIEKRIKEVQQEKKSSYSQEDVYINQGIENELISLKISLEKWRKKLKYSTNH